MRASIWEERGEETAEFGTWGRSYASAAHTVWREPGYGYGATAQRGYSEAREPTTTATHRAPTSTRTPTA